MFDIKVCTGAKCAVAISEINTNYLKENSTAIAKNKFRYSDTVSIDVLQLNKSTGQQIQNPVFTIRDSKINPVQLQVSFDGWFTICHIVIPNKQWFDKEHTKKTYSAINLYTTVYYSDGNKIYKPDFTLELHGQNVYIEYFGFSDPNHIFWNLYIC